MNNLAMLKAELEQKPIIKQKEDVKILITKGTVQPKMKLTMAMDDGLEAIRILNLMKQRKISNVSDKFPEQRIPILLPSKNIMLLFCEVSSSFQVNIDLLNKQIRMLINLQNLILAKMTRVESEKTIYS